MSERERITEAYIAMAQQAKYRPAAPGDGVGSVDLSPKQLRDKKLLREEAEQYANHFITQENTGKFYIGCTKFTTNRATVYALEAARLMCGAAHPKRILRLLRMASDDVAGKSA